MMLTKGAIGNLINRYSAVLKKCSLINTFGSLAVAGMLVVGSVAAAGAAASIGETQYGTLKDAVEKATSGATITLTEGELEAGGIIYKTRKDLVIDLNNNIYKATNDAAGSSGTKSQIFQLLKNSNITIKNGSITTKDGVPFLMGLQNYSNLTLDNVILQGTKTIQYLLSNNYGDINIKNSTIDVKQVAIDAKQVAFDVYYWPSGGYKEGVAVAIEDSIINGRIVVNTDEKAEIGNNKHSLTMTNCTLGGGLTAATSGGLTETSGGQLYAAGTTTISNVAFNQNKATNGGAIYNTVEKTSAGDISGRGILNLNNTTFTNNTATTNGGAIYNAGTVVFTGTNVFTGNTAAGAANDIYNATGGTVTIAEGTTTLNRGIVTAGTVNVTGGTLTVASLSQTSGLLSITGGTLNVSTDFDNVGYTTSAGVSITSGALQTGNTVLVKKDGDSYTIADNVKKIFVGQGGVITFTDFAQNSLNETQAEAIKTALFFNDSTGMINFGTGVVTFKKADDNTVSDTTLAKVGSIAQGETAKVTAVTASGSSTEKTTTVTGGYGADAIKVDKATTGDTVTATVSNDLTLLGTTDGKLVDAGGATVKIKLTTGKALNLGSAGATSHDASIDSVKLGAGSAVNAAAATYTVKGDIKASDSAITSTGDGKVTASAGGTLKVSGNIGGNTYFLKEVKAEGGNISVGGELHSHTVTATGGTIVANDVRPTDIALDKGGTLTTTNLTMTSGGKGITVGSTEGGAGTLIVTGEANLKGASLFLDPAWKGNDELKDASKAVLNFGDGGIDGLLTAGQNSYIVLGDTDTKWAENAFQNSGLKWGKNDVTAALFVKSSQSLATNGGILVDGKIDAAAFATGATNKATANTAEFRANSLLAVYAPNMLKDAALKGNSTSKLTVDKDAKLLIVGGKANDTVKIVSGFTAGSSTIGGWSGTNLTTDSKLLTANAGTLISGAYDVTLSQNSTRSIFPKLDKNMAGLVDGMVKQIGLDPMSENYGQRFVSRAVSDSYIGSNNTKEAAATIEGAAKMAFAGAAPQMGMNLANAAGNIAGLRNSLSAAPQGAVVALNADGTSAQEGLSAGDGMKNGLGLWVMPTYQNQQGFGFESGDFETGYKSNAAGVALGADYTFNDMFRVGAQFNVGGGYAESTGDFNSTDNRFNYWGLGLYAGYQYQNFGLTADFGYSANNNELEQSLPKAMDMASLKADAKTDTITAGLRGEYKITTDALDIVPHLGVRMTNMHMDSFNVKSDKHKVFKADDMNATVWTFPVGVTFSKDIETSNGWTIKPSLDLAIIPAAGDIEAKQDVKIVGVNGTASMESNIMDAISYQGSLGLSAKNDNGVSVGVNYTLQASQHTTDHGVQATFRYEF